MCPRKCHSGGITTCGDGWATRSTITRLPHRHNDQHNDRECTSPATWTQISAGATRYYRTTSINLATGLCACRRICKVSCDKGKGIAHTATRRTSTSLWGGSMALATRRIALWGSHSWTFSRTRGWSGPAQSDVPETTTRMRGSARASVSCLSWTRWAGRRTSPRHGRDEVCSVGSVWRWQKEGGEAGRPATWKKDMANDNPTNPATLRISV